MKYDVEFHIEGLLELLEKRCKSLEITCPGNLILKKKGFTPGPLDVEDLCCKICKEFVGFRYDGDKNMCPCTEINYNLVSKLGKVEYEVVKFEVVKRTWLAIERHWDRKK